MLHPFRLSLSIRFVVIALALVSAASWFSLRTHSHADAATLTSVRDVGSPAVAYSDPAKAEGRFLDRIASFGQSNDAFFDIVVGNATNTSYLLNATLVPEPPAPPPSGPIVTFVIGDLNSAIGTNVMFWGAQWWKNNSLSGGAAPSSFKGYANATTPSPATCAGTWKTTTGNSSNPPASVPQYITALVASSVTQSGSTISGNIVKMVVIQTNPGYDGNPGHSGTGKVVAVYCAACVPGNVCRPGNGVCDPAEICDANGQCPADAKAANGTSCSDGNACNGSETCNGGNCTAGTPLNCDDNNACTADSCNAVTGCAHAQINCNDNNACTTDSCNPSSGCVHSAVVTDDHDACTADACDPVSGVTHTPVAVDDGNACTADSCDPSTGVHHTTISCDDNNPCTTDSCDPTTGCRNTPVADGTLCAGGACEGGVCTDLCANVTCTPSDQCHTAGTCDPHTGQCTNPVASDGTACSDGNACTRGDSCQAGACTGGNAVVCTASDQCHDAGICDPQTGQCSNPAKADGSACNDGAACTQNDVCQGGTCSGTPGIEVCNGLDDDCDGVVDDVPEIGSACTGGGTNTTGICQAAYACTGTPGPGPNGLTCQQTVGPSPETCDGLDNDCDGIVDEGNPGGGFACSTGQLGVCSAGTTACTGGAITCNQNQQPSPETCNGLDDDCNGLVDEGNPGGGFACNTGQPGVCSAGITACTGGAITCNPSSQPSAEVCGDGLDNNCDGSVDEGCVCTPGSTTACYNGPAGTAGVGRCTAGMRTCNSFGTGYGACVGEVDPTTETCNGLDDDCDGQVDEGIAPTPTQCGSGACAGTGQLACVNGQMVDSCAPAPDGSACSDGNACTLSDTCQAGTCQGGTAKTCAALDQCHTAGICDPGTGQCSNPSAADGTACNDGNACTQSDSCQAGACTGANPVVCTALDQCHVTGTCNPATGTCSNPTAANGSACDDGNACTQSDSCQAGECSGGNPVVCTALDQCHTAGTCNPANGQCSNPAAEDGTACNDGNVCTTGDTCSNGACFGGSAANCDDGNSCTADSCDPGGGCQHTPVADGTACSDNGGTVCQAGTCTNPGGNVCVPGMWETNGPAGRISYSLGINPVTDNTVYTGTDNGVFKSTDAGQSWTAASVGLPVDPGDMTPRTVLALAHDPQATSPGILYAGIDVNTGGTLLFRSTDGGGIWAPTGMPPVFGGILAIALDPTAVADPSTQRTIYTAGLGSGVWKSTDGGASFSHVGDAAHGLTDQMLQSLALAPSSPNILYAGGGTLSGVFKSTDGGANWMSASSGLPMPGPGFFVQVRSLAIDPNNPDVVYAGTSGAGVYKTTDGGANWSDANNGIPNVFSTLHVDAVAIDPSTTSTVYAATQGGVFKSTDGGANWATFSNGLSNTNVQSFAIDPVNPAALYAGTSGDGVFEQCQTTCIPPPVNMIGWWPGDDNTTDIVSGNNGTWIGNPAYATGEVADAFSFDGASYLSMGSPPSLNITGNQVTIDGWIYPTVTNNDVVYFGSTAYGANDYALIFQFDQLTGMIKAGGSEPIVVATAGPYVPALSQWTHVALTYDGATMKLYANGAMIGSLAHTGNIDGDGSEFAIGGRTNDCCGRHFNFTGRIDEVEVFDRALTDAEIAAIYNAGSFGKCKQ